MIRIGINGFGRIGRSVVRAAQLLKDVESVHINDLTDSKTLAHLLKYDSVHGTLPQTVVAEDGAIRVGDHAITVSATKDPRELPWKEKKVDVVFECTGRFTDRKDCEMHLAAGAPRVLVSAPAKGEDRTVVFGVNHQNLAPTDKIVSNGSCTTNCLAPVAKVLNDEFKIIAGQMMTIHAYTNDQNILDLPHKDLRRARAAGLSMIPTSTGAAKAIGLVLPELNGKIGGTAVRVPTANVSLVDLTVSLEKEVTVQHINQVLKNAAEGALKGVMAYSEEPLVSIDYNGSPASSTVDSLSTMVSGGKLAKVLSWYDNETGFSHRMLDIAGYWVNKVRS
jgi:glyceraldehyde 3-phosphate dehydrogenase